MFTKLAVVLAVAGSAVAQTIQTPASLVECQPASLTFTGGTAPYILAAIPGGEVSAAAIETIDSALTSSPYTWTVNLASGTNITLKLTDSTGAIGYSSPLVIQAGSSTSCLNSTASTSGLVAGSVTTTQTSASVSGSSTAAVASSAAASSAAMSSAAASSAAASSAAASSAAASSAAASSAATSKAATSAAAGGASSAAGAATSAAGGATSAAASAVASATAAASGAQAIGVAALPVVLAGLIGGVVALF